MAVENQFKVVAPSRLNSTSSGILISYELPCATKRVGFATVAGGNRQIYLLVVLQQLSYGCLRLPQTVHEYIEYLSPDFKYLTKLPRYLMQPPGRLEIRSIERFQPTIVSSRRMHVQAIVETNCARFAGFVFAPSKTGAVGLGALQVKNAESDPTSTANCASEQESKKINFIATKFARRLKSFSEQSEIADLHYLRLAKVKSLQTRDSKNGFQHIQANFARNCNELPVGWIVTPKQINKVVTHVRLGVLLAQFVNRHCPGGALKMVASAELFLAKNVHIEKLPTLATKPQLRIVPPKGYAVASQPGRGHLVVDYFARACESEIGFVYRRVTPKTMWLGMLQQRNPSCSESYRSYSLTTPTFKNVSANQVVVPLKAKSTL